MTNITNNIADGTKRQAVEFPSDATNAEKLQILLQYAELAPSKYNIQPWVFEISGDSIDLFCDRHGVLEVADPDDRELIMSCGAALFNLRVAASCFGYDTTVQPFPHPGNECLTARVHLAPRNRPSQPFSPLPAGNRRNGTAARLREFSPSDEQLLHAIPVRRTYRRKFRLEIPPDNVLASCQAAAGRNGAWLCRVKDKVTERQIAALVARADREQMANKLFREEFSMWIRGANKNAKDGMPASAFGLAKCLNFLTPGLSLLMYSANLGRLMAARDHSLAVNAPVLVVLGTAQDNPEAWLAAGQAVEAVLLYATVAGLCASFLNSPIQVNQIRTRLAQTVACNGYPQALLRLGYGKQGPHTPRRPLHEVVVNPTDPASNFRTSLN
ncbi:MAG: nitroreductase [Verrucomicrobiota bacterium]|jgi:hypothetical protein